MLEILAERLKELRAKHKKTQREVAAAIGQREQVYQKYEHNNRTAGGDVLIRIADYFNVSVDYLLGRTDKSQFNK